MCLNMALLLSVAVTSEDEMDQEKDHSCSESPTCADHGHDSSPPPPLLITAATTTNTPHSHSDRRLPQSHPHYQTIPQVHRTLTQMHQVSGYPLSEAQQQQHHHHHAHVGMRNRPSTIPLESLNAPASYYSDKSTGSLYFPGMGLNFVSSPAAAAAAAAAVVASSSPASSTTRLAPPLDVLQRIFPFQKPRILELVLHACGGDVGKAIEHLISTTEGGLYATTAIANASANLGTSSSSSGNCSSNGMQGAANGVLSTAAVLGFHGHGATGLRNGMSLHPYFSRLGAFRGTGSRVSLGGGIQSAFTPLMPHHTASVGSHLAPPPSSSLPPPPAHQNIPFGPPSATSSSSSSSLVAVQGGRTSTTVAFGTEAMLAAGGTSTSLTSAPSSVQSHLSLVTGYAATLGQTYPPITNLLIHPSPCPLECSQCKTSRESLHQALPLRTMTAVTSTTSNGSSDKEDVATVAESTTSGGHQLEDDVVTVVDEPIKCE